jgi:methyl acetate hydrolase
MANTQAIDHVLRQAVQAHDVPGVVAMAATDQGIIYEGAFGTPELGTDAAMTPDTVVAIASMTKAITSAAAMQLVERGQLQLDSPAADVVPALGEVHVLTGFDASGTPQLRAPKRAMTLKHLLTHTAGFSTRCLTPILCSTRSHGHARHYDHRCRARPTVMRPGERWEYGLNIDWVGRWSGGERTKAGDYLGNLFAPLGMHSTRSSFLAAGAAGQHACAGARWGTRVFH